MKLTLSFCRVPLIFALMCSGFTARAQFLVDMVDTTTQQDKGLWAIYKKSDHLLVSGYFQPQYQAASAKGIESFAAGDFPKHANNRFIMRRGRIRFDYAHFTDEGLPQAQVVFQFDGTERGVFIRDFWGRFYENEWQLFAFTTGMFARPFGFEVNLSSSQRETPERGRMSQILMKTERDLGFMATFEPRKRTSPLRLLKLDVGIFNGQGLAGPEEYDSYKDIISRLSLKPYEISKKLSLSAGASILQGGLAQNTRYIYEMRNTGGTKTFAVDSSINNIGAKAPRLYRGFDAQLKLDNDWGATELRGEYWWGTQTGSARESTTPGEVLTGPYYIREFNGAFFYLLQELFSEKHQLILKYDFYDPNTHIAGNEIGTVANSSPGDIRFNTFGFGYTYYFNQHIKAVAWYDMVRNEITDLDGFTKDVDDNVFTLRMQFSF